MANLYEEHAREVSGLGSEFHLAVWEHKKSTRTKPERLDLTFMAAPKLASGEIAWKYADRKGKKVVTFTLAEHDHWTLDWERKTGKCRQCSKKNPGQEWIGWNHLTGDKFRACPRCQGTGKAPEVAHA